MQDVLHEELLTLQKNLQAVQTASQQVEIMRATAQTVVEAVQQLQQRYAEHLPMTLATLTSQQEEEFRSLERHYQDTVQHFILNLNEVKDKIALYYEKQHQEITENLDKYKAVVAAVVQLEDGIRKIDFPQKFILFDEHIQNIYIEIQKDVAALQQVKQHHDEHLVAVQTAHQYFLQAVVKNTEEKLQNNIEVFQLHGKEMLGQLQTSNQDFRQQITEYKAYIQQVFEGITAQHQQLYTQTTSTNTTIQQQIEGQIKTMLQGFEEQQSSLSAFVMRYEQLVAYTQTVEQKITALNFPQRLSQIAEQLANIEHTIEDKLGLFKAEVNRYWNDLDNKLGSFRKQSEGYFQVIESHNLVLQTQIEQLHRHLQQQIMESSKEEIIFLKEQNDALNLQLKHQNQQLFYLLWAVLGIGLVIILQTLLMFLK